MKYIVRKTSANLYIFVIACMCQIFLYETKNNVSVSIYIIIVCEEYANLLQSYLISSEDLCLDIFRLFESSKIVDDNHESSGSFHQ